MTVNALRITLTTQKLACLSVLTIIGAFFIIAATTGMVPYNISAPCEWIGVFCLAAEFAYLFSSSIGVSFAFVAALAGAILDPIFISGQSLQTWLLANLLVFGFALAGACTNTVAAKLGFIST